jgi:hypothetical protein
MSLPTIHHLQCRHFNGVDRGRCLAGVEYAEVRRPGGPGGPHWLYPCQRGNDRPDADGVRCDRYAPKTAEELAAEEAEFQQAWERINVALPAIREDAGKRRPHAGQIDPCPCCRRGTLHYRVASNGHAQASCTTDKCVTFIQ